MVEAILERRPSLEGIKTVQSKTTSEVRGKYVKFDEKKFLQGIGSLGEVQHIGAEFAAFGKGSGD